MDINTAKEAVFMNAEQKEFEAEEKYLVSSESVPMSIDDSSWNSMCDNSNLILNSEAIENLLLYVEHQAFNYLVNNDGMLTSSHVRQILDLLRSRDVLYIERSRYRKEEITWFRWAMKLGNGEVVISLRNEALESLIDRYTWPTKIKIKE